MAKYSQAADLIIPRSDIQYSYFKWIIHRDKLHVYMGQCPNVPIYANMTQFPFTFFVSTASELATI